MSDVLNSLAIQAAVRIEKSKDEMRAQLAHLLISTKTWEIMTANERKICVQHIVTDCESETRSTFLIGIECECGSGITTEEATRNRGFKHRANLGGVDVDLVCDCKKKYCIHPQQNHFHVFQRNNT